MIERELEVKEVKEMKEVEDKPKGLRIARLASGFVGVVFALFAIAIPIGGVFSLYVEPAPADVHMSHRLIGFAAYWLTIVSGFVFCALLSAVLVRYAVRGRPRPYVR